AFHFVGRDELRSASKFNLRAAPILEWADGKFKNDFSFAFRVGIRVRDVFEHDFEFALENFFDRSAADIAETYLVRSLHFFPFLPGRSVSAWKSSLMQIKQGRGCFAFFLPVFW